MGKPDLTWNDGWPVMGGLKGKEAAALDAGLVEGEQVVGLVIGRHNQAMVATTQKLFVAKSGLSAGQSFGTKATSFGYDTITAVEVRLALGRGVLQVATSALPVVDIKPGTDALQLPNVIVFPSNNRERPPFEAFAAKLREHIARRSPAAPAPDVAELLRELAALRDAGVLTEAEFGAKKAELLARM